MSGFDKHVSKVITTVVQESIRANQDQINKSIIDNIKKMVDDKFAQEDWVKKQVDQAVKEAVRRCMKGTGFTKTVQDSIERHTASDFLNELENL